MSLWEHSRYYKGFRGSSPVVVGSNHCSGEDNHGHWELPHEAYSVGDENPA